MLLNIRNHLASIGLIPVPIEVLGHDPELDDKVAGQILRLNLAPLLPPQTD
jgi:hypothetical protein